MTHLLKIAASALAFAVALSGCQQASGPASESTRALERVRSSSTLRAAYINYPPSMSVDPNTKVKSGVMHDVITRVAKNMGLTLQYTEETTFASMVDSVESGRSDIVVSGIWPSATRALRADFSKAVYFSPVYAYVRANDTRFDGNLSKADDPQVAVATIDGELSSIIAADDLSHARAVSLPQQTDVSQLLLQLTSKKADITFVEPAVAEQFIAKNAGSVHRLPNVEAVRLFPNSYLFRKGDTELRDAIDIAILELQNAAQISPILKGYDPEGKLFIAVSAPVSP